MFCMSFRLVNIIVVYWAANEHQHGWSTNALLWHLWQFCHKFRKLSFFLNESRVWVVSCQSIWLPIFPSYIVSYTEGDKERPGDNIRTVGGVWVACRPSLLRKKVRCAVADRFLRPLSSILTLFILRSLLFSLSCNLFIFFCILSFSFIFYLLLHLGWVYYIPDGSERRLAVALLEFFLLEQIIFLLSIF